MDTYFNIEYDPVSVSQGNYGMTAYSHFSLKCDV